ncbi:hypothetical protein ZIOFF_028486 [Zingiber officinale]|uniref:Uncharacterized protein n=1 Tax=Zingiber officinale TaxID=94328 RepID=A0A8J5LF02_ZINOF|nr:hypothetical protein ZIOFF_028486 [Zingiber officinale]
MHNGDSDEADSAKSIGGKMPRKLDLAIGGVKKPHHFFLGTVALREGSGTNELQLHCSIPYEDKDPCPCRVGIGNASDDIHNIAMAKDELSDDDRQAGEKRRRLNAE